MGYISKRQIINFPLFYLTEIMKPDMSETLHRLRDYCSKIPVQADIAVSRCIQVWLQFYIIIQSQYNLITSVFRFHFNVKKCSLR